MKTVGALALLILAVVALPSAQAQSPTGVTLTVGAMNAPIPYEGSGVLPVAVVVGCADILAAMAATGGSAPLTVSAEAAPAWLTVSDNTVDLASPDSVLPCLQGAATMTAALGLTLAVTKDAPGVVDNLVNFTATIADSSDGPKGGIVTVAYFVNYTLVPDVTFPLAVNGTEATFNVTVTQASNARSMVMMEQLKVSAGTLSGPASEVYANDAGQPVSKTFKFTFKAPETEWTNATATFTAYGHYLLLDGRAGEFNTPGCTALGFPTCDAAGTTMAFAFTNAEEHGDDHDEDKDAPAPVGALLALGLVALAAFARRRQ